MRGLAALLMPLLALLASPAGAQTIGYEDVAAHVIAEEAGDAGATGRGQGGERFVEARIRPEPAGAIPQGIAAYGPFRVLDETRAALVGETDRGSPAAFAAMLRTFPEIALIVMIDCAGTDDDVANLRLGRMIREAGLATHVPAGGSVRSGGVELFLAGARRSADALAEFAVHAWRDELGRGPGDVAADAPENRAYLDYYRAMGMSMAQARAFYAMTNAAPHDDALWLSGAEMARWVRLD